MGPLLYLCMALGAALPVTYGVMAVKNTWAVSAAYKQGKVDGAGAASAAGIDSANQTVGIIRDAEETTPLVTGAAIRELCKKRASCRERGQIK